MTYFCGYRTVAVIDDEGGKFPMTVLYPASSPEKDETLGPYRLSIAVDVPAAEGAFPLVLISHGSGGAPILYRSLARHLARNGFVVGMPEHPHNNRFDDSLRGTVEILVNRPRHLRKAADWFYGDREFAGCLKPDTVHAVGHSLGGYAALALAGGIPTPLPEQVAEGGPGPIETQKDPRIKSLVLLAPAAVWFRCEGALQGVRVPVLMIVGDRDEYTPYDYHGRLLRDGLPEDTEFRCEIVENGGHFSFLGPFPKAASKPSFPPSQDPPGFDRPAFLERLNGEVLEFLRIQS